jgi:hypothetical protein
VRALRRDRSDLLAVAYEQHRLVVDMPDERCIAEALRLDSRAQVRSSQLRL